MIDENDPALTLKPSLPRLYVALVVQVFISVLLLNIAFQINDLTALWLLFAALGMVSLVLSYNLWEARKRSLRLTQSGLVDENGNIVVARADMKTVAKSLFSLKPSNGFAIICHKPLKFAWRQGIYWRIGRRVGIGGLLPSGQTKFVAECLSQVLEDT